MTPSRRLLAEAAERMLDLRAAPDDPRRQADLRAWVDADPAHRHAWALAERAWIASGDALDFTRRPAANRNRPRRRALGLAVAAALALAAAPEIWLRLAADVATPAGAPRAVALADGSTVTLAGDSAIVVRLGGGERHVDLLRGAAFFEVAPDAAHPFVVAAGDATVTVLGTGFTVTREDNGVGVAVAHGLVNVRTDGGDTRLTTGQRLGADGRNVSAIPPADVALWREDRIAVTDRPLGTVVDALARRHGGIYLVPAAVRARHVTGVFDLDDPGRALAALLAPQGLAARPVIPGIWRTVKK